MEKYQICCDSVISYLRDKDVESERVGWYEKCYSTFTAYLTENNIAYTYETALNWLETVQPLSKYMRSIYYTALLRANDVFEVGYIRKRKLKFCNSKDSELCEGYYKILTGFLDTQIGMAEATIRNRKYSVREILLSMQRRGIWEVRDLKYGDILDILQEFDNGVYYAKSRSVEMCQYLLNYLYSLGLIPYGFILLPSSFSHSGFTFWGIDNPDMVVQLIDSYTGKEISLTAYLEAQTYILCYMQERRYSKSSMAKFDVCATHFYLFMDMNHLLFSRYVMNAWLESIRNSIEHGYFNDCRRAVSLIESYLRTGICDMTRIYGLKDTRFDKLPDWCKEAIDEYMVMKTAEGWAKSTLSMHFNCSSRFCEFLVEQGLNSFNDLTRKLIKRFNIEDVHETFAGKSAYNSRIRMFLDFLEDAGYTTVHGLSFALPETPAPCTDTVIVLTDEESAQLEEELKPENTTLTLREKAIIELGLHLGLRTCDITNIKLRDIDWDTQTLTIIQKKTQVGLELPMPDSVVNAIYRYIAHERPVSDCENVFIKNRAAYDAMEPVTCQTALKHALPGRNIPKSGFHVLRKTYATQLVRNQATFQQVRDGLGHTDTATLKRYLSLDSERMKECPIPLKTDHIRFEEEDNE